MNHTPLFDLSQWEKSDRIQMEDFNSDNLKIENALGRRLELAVMMDKTVRVSDVTSYSIPFDGIKPYDCFAIFIEIIDFPTTTTLTLHSGKSSTVLCSNFYAQMAFMGFPLRNPDSSIVLLPISRATSISPFTYDRYFSMNALTFKASSSGKIAGTFHVRVTAIL